MIDCQSSENPMSLKFIECVYDGFLSNSEITNDLNSSKNWCENKVFKMYTSGHLVEFNNEGNSCKLFV